MPPRKPSKDTPPKQAGADALRTGTLSSRSPRKLIEFDPSTLQALELLSRDSMKDMQELADEAFRDLLKKHGRPTDLKDALRRSARQLPANDQPPEAPRRRR